MLSLVGLDCVGLDAHVWVVATKKLEGVGAFHFLVVLYSNPRLGEVFKDGEGSSISEAHVFFVEFNEILVLDVRDEHCDADLGCGFLDVVRSPTFVLHLGQAKEIYLPCVILDVWVYSCWFRQSYVGHKRTVRCDFEVVVFEGEGEAPKFSG